MLVFSRAPVGDGGLRRSYPLAWVPSFREPMPVVLFHTLHHRRGFSRYLAASRLFFLIYNFIVILLCDINIFCNFAVNQYSYGDAGGC